MYMQFENEIYTLHYILDKSKYLEFICGNIIGAKYYSNAFTNTNLKMRLTLNSPL